MSILKPPPVGAPHESAVFQDWYSQVYKILTSINSNLDNLAFQSNSQHLGAYPAFGIRAGTNITISQDALGFKINATAGGSSDQTENRIFADRSKNTFNNVRAGNSISVTQDALGYSIASIVDSDQHILATQVYGA